MVNIHNAVIAYAEAYAVYQENIGYMATLTQEANFKIAKRQTIAALRAMLKVCDSIDATNGLAYDWRMQLNKVQTTKFTPVS